jgi:hypothetical protein
MNTRVERIQELLKQKAAIDGELAEIKAQAKAERAAFDASRKPRKKKQGALPLEAA